MLRLSKHEAGLFNGLSPSPFVISNFRAFVIL